MNDKDLKRIVDLAKQKLKSGITKDDAMEAFIFAGILKKNGEFAKPYKHLSTIITDNQ